MSLPAAKMGDNHGCPQVNLLVPHVGGPVLATQARVIVGGLPAERLADFSICTGPADVIAQGSTTVLWQGLPASRVSDQTVHGGFIAGPGVPTVLIGGPPFTLPANFTLKGPPDFQNKLIRDLYLLSTTPSGKAILARLGASGQPVTFVPLAGTNGYCTPNDGGDAKNGNGTGSVIQWNPDYRSNAYDSAGNLLAQPPQVILGHEMCHALANAEGRQAQGTDPSPPASEPAIDQEEAQAIGTGSHSGDSPSENTLRSDLGEPRRDNHFGTGGPNPGEPAPLSLRPGGY